MTLARKLETTANVATIFVSALISVVLFKIYLRPPNLHKQAVVSAPFSNLLPGSSVDGRALGVEWSKNQQTLVLALSTVCHYCRDSAPFYRKLVAETRNVRMLAVLPQPISESQQYLLANGVRIDEIRQLPLNTLGVMATPTLLMVDDRGVLTHIWVGRLEPQQEAEVLGALSMQRGTR